MGKEWIPDQVGDDRLRRGPGGVNEKHATTSICNGPFTNYATSGAVELVMGRQSIKAIEQCVESFPGICYFPSKENNEKQENTHNTRND